MAASSPSPNPRVSVDAVARAVEALLKWMRARAKQQKAQLLEHDDLLYLVLTLKRIPPKGRTNPYRIPLPHLLHPLDSSSTSICLLTDDRPSSPLPPSAALDQIRTLSLPISSVIGLSDLKSDYRPFESRRRLCDSHDIFFADRKIIPLLPRLLGKHFFKRKKIPLVVDLSRPGWPEQIRSGCGSTLLYLRTGTCSGLKVGRVSQDRDEIVKNVMAAIEGAMEFVPKKWGNVRSLHIKSVDSLALPIYQALPEMGLKIEGFWKEENDKDGILMVEGGDVEEVKKRLRSSEKKGRIHEVGYMDSDLEGGKDDDDREEEKMDEELAVEKRVRKKLKKDVAEKKNYKKGEIDGNNDEEKDSEELGGEKGMKKKAKKGVKAKKEKDGLMNEDDHDDNDGVHMDDHEEEKVSDELGVEKGMKKKKRKKDGKVTKEMVKEGTRSGNEYDGEEEKGSNELSVKKKMKMKKKMEEDAAAAADGVKKSKPKKLEDKDAKKTKRSKVRHETD